MSKTRNWPTVLGLALGVAALGGACGGGSSSAGSRATSTSPSATSATTVAGSDYGGYGGGSSTTAAAPVAAVVAKTGTTKLGATLVDGSGKTLYAFARDTATASNCNGACATLWPPVVVSGEPSVGPGLDKSMFTTITRADGAKQLSVAGHPLYTYGPDTAAGDTNGQGVGGVWRAVGPTGGLLGA